MILSKLFKKVFITESD
jgi:cytidyltransferase-like protein